MEPRFRALALASVFRRSAKHAAASLLPRSWLMVHGPRAGKKIALTFDDGPCDQTSALLAVLERHRVRATFFLIGKQISRMPRAADSIARLGHQIANHGFTHRVFDRLSSAELVDELERTERLIPVEQNRCIVRPPHGSVSPRSLLACARAGYVTALWSYDPDDSRAQSADQLIAAFERRPPRPGDIVLLHEDRRPTLEALPRLLSLLATRGFELVTVDELFRTSPSA